MSPHSFDDPRESPLPFDNHTIDTPEQLALEFPLAGIGSRSLAMIIDSLIQTVVLIVAMLGFVLVMAVLGASDRNSPWFAGAAIVCFFLVYVCYFAIFEVLWNGQTPGKRKMGIRVMKESGRPLTVAETIGRNVMRLVDQLPFFYGIAILTALLNSRNKRLGDLLVGAIVIRETSETIPDAGWQAMSNYAGEPQASHGASALTEADLTLIDTFLNRRANLNEDVRRHMASQVLDKLRPRLFNIPADRSPESIIESLAWERRSTGGR